MFYKLQAKKYTRPIFAIITKASVSICNYAVYDLKVWVNRNVLVGFSTQQSPLFTFKSKIFATMTLSVSPGTLFFHPSQYRCALEYSTFLQSNRKEPKN